LCDMTHPFMRRDSFIRATSHGTQWHDSFMCGTWLIHVCDMTQLWVANDLLLRDTSSTGGGGTWPIHMWDLTHSCVQHESFVCDTRLAFMCDIIDEMRVWHNSITCVTRFIRACDMAYSHVWLDLCVRVTWLTLKCMTSSTRCVLIDVCVCGCMCVHGCVRVWTRWFICATCLIHVCDVTHIYMCHYTFILNVTYLHMWCVENESCHIRLQAFKIVSCCKYEWAMSYLRMSHVTHMK